MKQRLADYVADFLAAHGVTDVFSVVGGGAMHLNDALGHHPALHVTYNHHEQASAIAAEAYARIDNKIAALCVTTGPGGWLAGFYPYVCNLRPGSVRYHGPLCRAVYRWPAPARGGRPGIRYHQICCPHDQIRHHAGRPEPDPLCAGKSLAPGNHRPPRPGVDRHSRQLSGRLYRNGKPARL